MGEARRRKLANSTQPTSDLHQAAGKWPLSNSAAQQQLEAWFVKRAMDPSKPGLHDTPEFLEAERRDRRALDMVARLVEARSYTAEELSEAERKIDVAAHAIANRVARDGRPGMCVVASGVLSRMLDELGVWNYTAKSNVAIHFPRAVSLEPRYFYSLDHGQFVAPHAIVVAPPFTVVDVTAKHQRYDEEAMARWVPAMVVTKDWRPYRVTSNELISPSARMELRARGVTVDRYLAEEQAHMLEFVKLLPPREVAIDGGRLGYALVGASGYQERLRDLHGSNCSIDGLTPLEIFEKDVLPKL